LEPGGLAVAVGSNCYRPAGLFSVAALILNEWLSGKRVEARQESPLVHAQANTMPNQGWVPLQVYFSAFGIQSEGNTIIRYEWDLNGNGSLEFDFSRHAQCKACTGDGESLLLTSFWCERSTTAH